jgi:hypothetical protein
MTRSLPWAPALILLAAGTALGQSYCSLRVKVVTRDGGLVAAQVFVEESDGHKEYRLLRGKGDEAAFCDLGILPATVKVGVDGDCGQVIVRNVALAWQRESVLKVTYDRRDCPTDAIGPPTPVCLILFRLTGPGSQPVRGAQIRIVGGAKPADLTTDQYGRAAHFADLGATVRGAIEAPGGGPAETFSFACTTADYGQPGLWLHEEKIKLRTPADGSR